MLAVGARVRLQGLQAKPELNGREGILQERQADTGRWKVRVGDSGEFALKAANLELLHPGYRSQPQAAPAAANGGNAASEVLEEFDKLLCNLETTRRSILEVMAYCMDHASEHATALAQRLAKSLGKPGQGTAAYRARLLAVSDLLHNSRGRREGAARFGASLQELLPEACEKMGRVWLRRIEANDEREGAEGFMRKLLGLWQDWGLFPPLFVKGLESLLFSQVYEISAKEAGSEVDTLLRQKLTRWFAGLNQAELPHACQQRGLAGKSLQMATCRARLCHFERYWHLSPGSKVRLNGLLSAPQLNGAVAFCVLWDFGTARWKVRMLDGNVKSVKQENLLLEETPPAPKKAAPPRPLEKREEEENSIDGEPLTPEELRELEELERREQLESGKAPLGKLQCGYGVWSQVSATEGANLLVAPADYAACQR